MSEVRDILDAAADLIEPEGAWVQHKWAENAAGETLVCGNEQGACRWCIDGAFDKVMGRSCGVSAIEVWDAFRATHGVGPTWFNDREGRTQAEVVAALRKAAEEA